MKNAVVATGAAASAVAEIAPAADARPATVPAARDREVPAVTRAVPVPVAPVATDAAHLVVAPGGTSVRAATVRLNRNAPLPNPWWRSTCSSAPMNTELIPSRVRSR